MADPARKLADALEEYRKARPMGINLVTGERIEIDNERTGVLDYQSRTIIDPAHAHLITGAPTDRAIMEDLQQRADELLHAIDLARTTITGAIPLQTLDLVRPKVKDVLANLAGTIEKDM